MARSSRLRTSGSRCRRRTAAGSETTARRPRPASTGRSGCSEYWSDINNVFQFVRVEDIAYDKRSGMGNVVYIVDSGRGTGRRDRPGVSTNGRVWRMELDPDNPTVADLLRVLVEGDDNPVKTLGEVQQPDNVESTATGLLLTGDPGRASSSRSARPIPTRRRHGCGRFRSPARRRSSSRSTSRSTARPHRRRRARTRQPRRGSRVASSTRPRPSGPVRS